MANNKRPKPTERPKNPARNRFKKRRTRRIDIISRKGQPQVTARVKRLRKDFEPASGRVSSSWIAALQWDPKRGIVLMALKDGKMYDVPIPFKLFEEWYWAHSKGTFFNMKIRSRYKNKIKRVR
jgi:hypothetical protein